MRPGGELFGKADSARHFMFGQLIPCGGGKPIPLTRRSVLLGPRSQQAGGGHLCELKLVDGSWMVRSLVAVAGGQVGVNGRPCEMAMLEPGDVLTLGRLRLRIDYDSFNAAALPDVDQPVVVPPHGSRADNAPGEPNARRKSEAGSAHLGVLVPCGGGPTIRLHKPELTLGRGPSCDIVLRHRTISTQHCRLLLQQGYWMVEDLGSTNGTRVGGILCRRGWLYPGDELTVGETKPRLRVEYRAPGPPPPPIEGEPADAFKRSLAELAGVDAASLPDERRPPPSRWEIGDNS